jgi:tetratricopeptide (TPR) repeat protein
MKAFEEIYIQILVEYILYKQDRNPLKDWGHIRWQTTIFSYCRYNQFPLCLLVPHVEDTILGFSISQEKGNFSEQEKMFIQKYHLFNQESILLWSTIEEQDKKIFPFISIIFEWYAQNCERHVLEDILGSHYLIDFLFAISFTKRGPRDYYFRFSEMLDTISLKYLLLSFKKNQQFLFSSIALASYYFHTWDTKKAYAFYMHALSLDTENPWVMAKFSILLSSIPWEKNLLKAENMIERVVSLLSDSPWVYVWQAEIYNKLWKCIQTLHSIEKYEQMTEWKYRTFEPFMRKAESLLELWDYKKAEYELQKIDQYYLWEGYRFIYDILIHRVQKYIKRFG